MIQQIPQNIAFDLRNQRAQSPMVSPNDMSLFNKWVKIRSESRSLGEVARAEFMKNLALRFITDKLSKFSPSILPGETVESIPITEQRPYTETIPATIQRPYTETIPSAQQRPYTETIPSNQQRPQVEIFPGSPQKPHIERSIGNEIIKLPITAGKEVYVYKNPTDADLQDVIGQFREAYPKAPVGEVKVRKMIDEKGNEYIWMSGNATHREVEAGLKRKYGVDAGQNFTPIPQKPISYGVGEYQHILRSGTDIEKLKAEGFKSGIGPNAMLRWDGEPTDIMQKKYAPKDGDTILYIPKQWIIDTPNGPKIKNGFMPKDENIVKYRKTRKE